MPLPFKASLVTPESIMLEAMVTAAQIPAFDGQVGILHLRAPLLARLGTGVLRLDIQDQGPRQFVVFGGYAQMKGDELTILATEAIAASQVTAQLIAEEQARLDAVQGTQLAAMQQRSMLQARISALHAVMNA